jgi:hypothetical protein
MAVCRVVRTVKLNQAERIDIVRQNGDGEVVLALVEERMNIQDRKTIRLTLSQANKLARILAGVSIQPGADSDDLD